MTHSDPRCAIRLAVALTILKHRPRDQSTTSYLLDLQSLFPVATRHNESRGWRTYALELEKQLATFQTQRDADLGVIPHASQLASTSDAPPPNKKTKKNPTRDQHDPEWNWEQNCANWSRILSSQYPLSPSLTAAYTSLKGALTGPNADPLSFAPRITDAILRALDTVHFFLFAPTNSGLDAPSQSALDAPRCLKPEHIDGARIELASPLLSYILRTALHTLVRIVQNSAKSKRPRQRPHIAFTDTHVHIDNVIDHLLECILLPLLRAITPLCFARLAPLVSAPLKKGVGKPSRAIGKSKDKDKDTSSAISFDSWKKTDMRTDVLALIGTSLEALDVLPPLVHRSGPGGEELSSIAGSVRDRVGLEAIHELVTLYPVPSFPAPAPVLLSPSSALQPSSGQPLAAPSEAPPSLSTPDLTPLPAPSQIHSQPPPRAQQRAVPESRAKRLERLAGTRARRVRALATRDAGWFLANTLNLCVTSASAATQVHSVLCDASAGTGTSRLLRDALLNHIGKLVRSVCVSLGGPVSDGVGQGTRFVIDPVCQNMLLAICERAVSHLALS